MQEPAGHRSVSVELTKEQEELLVLKKTGTDCGREVFEYIGQCFVEQEARP
jgi:hypothetical protein